MQKRLWYSSFHEHDAVLRFDTYDGSTPRDRLVGVLGLEEPTIGRKDGILRGDLRQYDQRWLLPAGQGHSKTEKRGGGAPTS